MKKTQIVFYSIDWETDGEKIDLPKNVTVDLSKFDKDTDFSLEGADFLSNEYGWLVNNFKFKLK